ncbi:MAG: tetratricopeptide repeat protein [Chitinispirillaceae bacterium]
MHIIFFLLLILPVQLLAQDGEHLSKGNEHYRNGEYTEAIKSYRIAISKGENPALSWFNLANAWYQNGNPEKAVSCYESSVAIAPEFPRGWINLGVLYYELKDYGACIAALDRALQLKAADAMIWSLLASAHKELEHYGIAAMYFEKAVEADSSLSDAYLALYDIARITGDNSEALRWLSRYPQAGGRYYDVLLLSGELQLESGDTAAALATLRQCTATNPSRIQGWILLVNVLENMGATYTALIEADRALDNDDSSVSLALIAGRIAFENGYYDKAERYFGQAYKNGSADGMVGLGNLLVHYERYGDIQGINRIRTVLADGTR